jgi:peptidoglycan/xylan/chitin deacetylase (PgdA/CDA1 family)
MRTCAARFAAAALGGVKRFAALAFCCCGGARLVRWLARRAFPGAVRVLYCHDICAFEPGTARAPGPLNAAEFERRVLHIKRHYGFLTLEQALARLRSEPAARGLPVMLTFDDGYRSFARLAYPILRQHAIPVVLCVTTGAVAERGLWTDEVREAIQRAVFATVTTPLSQARLKLGDPASRAAAAEALIAELKRLPDRERRRAVRELCERAGPPRDWRRKMLDWDELRQLARDGLVTIGAHSVTHPILSRMEEPEAEAEIRGPRQELERALGIPVTVFSYPNGRQEDFTAACQQMAAAAGYGIAFSTMGGLARPGCDLYAVPRGSLAWEPWPRFVLRMAGLDDLRERARQLRRCRAGKGESPPAAEAQMRSQSLVGDLRKN